MSKVSLLRSIPTNSLLKMIPPHLRVLIDTNSIKQEKVNVALFSSDNKYVTTSGDVKKVTDNIVRLRPLLAIGWSFTAEAAQMIREVADYFACKEEGFWTDQSYHNARQK